MKLAFVLGVLLLGVLAESPPPIPPWLAEALGFERFCFTNISVSTLPNTESSLLNSAESAEPLFCRAATALQRCVRLAVLCARWR